MAGYISSTFNNTHWAIESLSTVAKEPHEKCRIEPQVNSIHLISDFQSFRMISLFPYWLKISVSPGQTGKESKKGQHLLDSWEALIFWLTKFHPKGMNQGLPLETTDYY